MRNIREEHQLGMRSLLQFMGKLFQLRLLYFQQFLLLYQLGFLFLQFLFCMDSSRFNRFLTRKER